MWAFGHLGIGSKIAAPMSRKLPYGWLLLGTLLPDLIDKPLYYGMSLFTGDSGVDLGLISCTRTVGHTGIFALSIALLAFARRSKTMAAIALGVASHLLLDGLQDYWARKFLGVAGESSLAMAALFPFFTGSFDPRFAIMPGKSLGERLSSGALPFIAVSETLGLAILAWDYWKLKWCPKRVLRSGSLSRRPRADR
jgi:hypothetical protein